jgi:putative aminopeptidase FrvX
MTTEIIKYLEQLLNIDSPTGFFRSADDFVIREAEKLGFSAVRLNKGGVLATWESEDVTAQSRLTVSAHLDTLGFMVRRILDNGTLQITPLGGLPAFYGLDTNVKLHTRSGKSYTGTVRRRNSCIHLMSEAERKAELNYDENLCLCLDEDVKNVEDVRNLGIECGDFAAVEPDFRISESGYIKSRFLDDKASCAVLLALMARISRRELMPSRPLSFLFTEYEEIGHGGSCGTPSDTGDFIAVDIGCVGPRQYSDEHKVTIGTKDSRYPYHYEFTGELIALAKANSIPFAVDMLLPSYGSDADAALNAGYDIRHALIGPGVLETHGYERTHTDALTATLALLEASVCLRAL